MFRFEINNFKLTAGEYEGLYCKVPCSLYSVLLENRLIDSPYYRKNYKDLVASIPDSACFDTVINLGKSVTDAKYVYLKLSGVYGNGELIINGKSTAILSSVDKIHFIDISDKLVEGENSFQIALHSPISAVRELYVGENGIDTVRGAPFVKDMGIFDAPQILATNSVLIESVNIEQKHLDGKVTLEMSLSTLGAADDMRAVVTLTSSVGKMYFGSIVNGYGVITVSEPDLWWPRGLGEPSLYKIEVTLYCGEEAEDTWQSQIGLRDISFSDDGSISVNGRAFLPFGMEYHADDIILPGASYERTEALIKAAAEANVNTLKPAVMNLLPSADLLNLCDKYGILMPISIAVPYGKMTAGAEFTVNVTEYLLNMTRKIFNHPSAVICGIKGATKDNTELPATVDSLTEFLTSVRRVAWGVIGKSDSSYLEIINIGSEACRNIASLPSGKTVEQFTASEDRNLMSSVMEAHADSPEDLMNMLVATVSEYRLPCGNEELTYAGALCSSDAFAGKVKSCRMARSSSLVADFARLNDAWPAISSSAIDFYGRPKALYYSARRMLAPVIAVVETSCSRARFGISNGGKQAFVGKLTYALYNAFDKCLKETSETVEIEAGQSSWLFEVDFAEYMTEELSEYYLVYDLYDSVGAIGNGSSRFVPAKHFRFRDPHIKAKVTGRAGNFEITLASEAYAAGVELDFSDTDATFSDNYFDMLDGIPVRISVQTKDAITAERLENMLSIRSMYDIGRGKNN